MADINALAEILRQLEFSKSGGVKDEDTLGRLFGYAKAGTDIADTLTKTKKNSLEMKPIGDYSNIPSLKSESTMRDLFNNQENQRQDDERRKILAEIMGAPKPITQEQDAMQRNPERYVTPQEFESPREKFQKEQGYSADTPTSIALAMEKADKDQITQKWLMDQAFKDARNKETADAMAGRQEKGFAQKEEELLTPDEAIKLGVPYGTKRKEAKGKTPQKPATEGEKTTSIYANRLEQSGEIINGLEDYVKGTSATAFETQSRLPNIANKLKSKEFQSLEQAKRNFLNATLRRESGAVISPTEFAEGNRQYFPLPGDDDATLEQKRKNREIVKQGFVRISGSAYTPLPDELKSIKTKDQLALEWANANPKDPRSALIKQKAKLSLGGR